MTPVRAASAVRVSAQEGPRPTLTPSRFPCAAREDTPHQLRRSLRAPPSHPSVSRPVAPPLRPPERMTRRRSALVGWTRLPSTNTPSASRPCAVPAPVVASSLSTHPHRGRGPARAAEPRPPLRRLPDHCPATASPRRLRSRPAALALWPLHGLVCLSTGFRLRLPPPSGPPRAPTHQQPPDLRSQAPRLVPRCVLLLGSEGQLLRRAADFELHRAHQRARSTLSSSCNIRPRVKRHPSVTDYEPFHLKLLHTDASLKHTSVPRYSVAQTSERH